MELPRFIYLLKFVHRDGDEPDAYEHISLEDARHHLSLFDNRDADIYERIELYRRDFAGYTDTLLESRTFFA